MDEFVIKDTQRNDYIEVFRFTRGMEIVTQFEHVLTHKVATKFRSEQAAQSMINEGKLRQNIETLIVESVADIESRLAEEADKKSDAIIKDAWINTTVAKRKKMLKEMDKEQLAKLFGILGVKTKKAATELKE